MNKPLKQYDSQLTDKLIPLATYTEYSYIKQINFVTTNQLWDGIILIELYYIKSLFGY